MNLTEQQLQIIREVNASWNEKIRYMTDEALHGFKEYWTFPHIVDGGYQGDCEDYAIAKKQTLIKEHDIACYFATCWCFPNKEGYHAVAIVPSQIGIIVLDNRYKILRLAKNMEYDWHSMEVKNNKWVHFKDRTPAEPPRGYVEMFNRVR